LKDGIRKAVLGSSGSAAEGEQKENMVADLNNTTDISYW